MVDQIEVRPSPLQRVYRTIAQVLLAVCAAIPAAVALVDIPASVAVKVSGIAGALTIIVSAAHNAVNAQNALKENQ